MTCHDIVMTYHGILSNGQTIIKVVERAFRQSHRTGRVVDQLDARVNDGRLDQPCQDDPAKRHLPSRCCTRAPASTAAEEVDERRYPAYSGGKTTL